MRDVTIVSPEVSSQYNARIINPEMGQWYVSLAHDYPISYKHYANKALPFLMEQILEIYRI